jgi:hypothetical protein
MSPPTPTSPLPAVAAANACALAATDTLGTASVLSDADRRAYYQKSLFAAIRTSRVEDVTLAFEEGCPVDLIDELSGDNALLAAARAGDVRVVKLCLNAAVPFMPYGPEGENALQVAVLGGSYACVEAIIRVAHEADEEDQVGYVLSLPNAGGDTPLHLAAAAGHSDIIKFFLRFSSAEVLLRNGEDCTPLHCACASAGRAESAMKKPGKHAVKTVLVGGREGPCAVDFEATGAFALPPPFPPPPPPLTVVAPFLLKRRPPPRPSSSQWSS